MSFDVKNVRIFMLLSVENLKEGAVTLAPERNGFSVYFSRFGYFYISEISENKVEKNAAEGKCRKKHNTEKKRKEAPKVTLRENRGELGGQWCE